MATLNHHSLNATFKGVSIVPRPPLGITSTPSAIPDLVQFRGIKFAAVPARFSPAEPIDDWGGTTVDCTNFGPICPQLPTDFSQLVGLPCIDEEPEPQDEFDCLRLNVMVPRTVLERARDGKGKVPVLVWIHGGSFIATIGSGQRKHADPTAFVAHSVRIGKPIIIVSINYRLGMFGFSYFAATSSRPAIANEGLRDQKLALRWVQKHISEFGGDSHNVTVFGESAGAISIHALMQSPYSPLKGEELLLFSRAIMQSGSFYTNFPQPPAVMEGLIKELCEVLRIDQNGDIVEELRKVSERELVDAIPRAGIVGAMITDDSDEDNGGVVYARGKRDWRKSGYGRWLKGVMVGEVEHEAVLQHISAAQHTSTSIANLFFTSKISEEAVRQILQTYNILIPDSSATAAKIQELNKQARSGVLDFIGDIRFGVATHCFLPQTLYRNDNLEPQLPVYRYTIHQPSPFQSHLPGVAKGRAFHTVDLLLLFQGYDMPSDGDEEAYEVGRVMQEKWINFAYGENVWDEDRIIAFGRGMKNTGLLGNKGDDIFEQLKGRRNVDGWRLLNKLGWDELKKVIIKVTGPGGVRLNPWFKVWE